MAVLGRVEARVEVAIKALLKQDAALLTLDASERAIAHRLACHLTDVLPGWDVDCEYNRDRHDPKALRSLPEPLLGGRVERHVYPDIVVHHRNSDDNLLVIEVKKTTGEQSSAYDLAKLKAYRTDLGYQYALFVRFETGLGEPSVKELRWVDLETPRTAPTQPASEEGRGSPSATFLGVDLAWGEGNGTGLAALELNDGRLQLVDPPTAAGTRAEVLAFVKGKTRQITVVAVDAPLIVGNAVGQRPCEKEIGRLFWKYEASAHSTNLSRDPEPIGVQLAKDLQAEEAGGFFHPLPDQEPMPRSAHTIIEVYPHPAQVRLFQLDKTLKYKKATGPGRQTALKDYRGRLLGILQREDLVPSPASLEFFGRDLAASRRLKEYEDQLDAVFCALLAYRFWRFGWQETEMIGDLISGYIAVPKEPSK